MNSTPIRALVIALGVLLLVSGAVFASLQTDDRSNPAGPGVNTESSATEVPEASESPDASENENDAEEGDVENEDDGAIDSEGAEDAAEASESPEPSDDANDD